MEANAYRQFLELERTHWWFRGRRTVYFGLLRHYLDGRRPHDALDLGCGMGGFLAGLDELCERVHPSDISVESLAHCADRGFPGGVVSSGYSLPYADASFDLVCMFDAIEHIPDDVGVLHETRRILKPDGLVFISVPAYQFLFSQNDRLVHHCRRYTRRQLERRLRDTGFQVLRATYFNALLFPLIIPAVLTVKLKERLVGLPDEQTNLSHEFPGPINEVFTWAMSSERHLLKNMSFPFGHSLIAIARPR